MREKEWCWMVKGQREERKVTERERDRPTEIHEREEIKGEAVKVSTKRIGEEEKKG